MGEPPFCYFFSAVKVDGSNPRSGSFARNYFLPFSFLFGLGCGAASLFPSLRRYLNSHFDILKVGPYMPQAEIK